MNFPSSPTLNQTYSLGDKTWKWNGVAWDLESTALTSAHVIAALGYTPYNAASLSSALSPYLLSATAASTYQPVDADLTAIAALTGSSGFLKTNGSGTWSVDTATYLTTATAASTYQTQSGMSSYLTTATASSTYLPLAGGTLTGNLSFSGTGLRITGDFSNATMLSRTLFQSSTANGNTQVGAIPNGTAVNSAFFTYNNSDPTNASTGILRINGSEVALISGITGTGTYLPMVFLTNNLERGRFDTAGNFGIGATSPATRLHVYNASITGGAPASTGSSADPNSVTRLGMSSVVMDFGAYANGDGWLQMRSGSNYATNYGVGINPNGGRVFFGGAIQEAKSAIAASAINLSLGNYFTKTISGATTFTVSNVPTTGTAASFILDLTNGGSATVTWWTGVKWAGGTAPTLTSAGRDVLGFFTHDGGTTWTGAVIGKDVK